MQYRRLGQSDLRIAAVGLGCMGMSQAYGARDDEESARTVGRALDLGVNFIDTADMYGNGHNEELVGRALAGRRREAVLASKFGNIRTAAGGQDVNGRPDYVPRACEASLERLGVEVIDLYYLHRVDPNVPIEDSVGAMARLVEQGKVRHLGLSEASAATLRRAHAVHPIAALQTEYSLWSRDVEAEILPACRELGVTFVPYAPLGRAFLTGAIRDLEGLSDKDRRREMPRFQAENLERNRRLLGAIEEVAEAEGCTAAQVALAWLLAKGEDVVPIPGTKRRRYLEENAAAVEIALSADEVAALDEAFPAGAAAGERYAPGDMRRVNL
jgi:aryl-alcohol dehydrogenase-like predicted oxidoreductase